MQMPLNVFLDRVETFINLFLSKRKHPTYTAGQPLLYILEGDVRVNCADVAITKANGMLTVQAGNSTLYVQRDSEHKKRVTCFQGVTDCVDPEEFAKLRPNIDLILLLARMVKGEFHAITEVTDPVTFKSYPTETLKREFIIDFVATVKQAVAEQFPSLKVKEQPAKAFEAHILLQEGRIALRWDDPTYPHVPLVTYNVGNQEFTPSRWLTLSKEMAVLTAVSKKMGTSITAAQQN